MKHFILSLACILLVTSAVTVSAIPIENWNGSDFIDTYDDGSSYGYFTNSGYFLFIEPGNNEGSFSPNVEAAIEAHYGWNPSEFALSETTMLFTNYNADGEIVSGASRSGTWEVVSPGHAINFYAVKAGDAYALYGVIPAEGTGSWSTYDLWSAGYGGTGGLEISHFSGYNPDIAPVPEPASILLLMMGIGGLGLNRIRRKK